jgi:fatty-acyl-CoA synthase
MIGGIGVPLIGLLILMTFITSLLVVFIKPRAGFRALAVMWLVGVGAAGMAFSAISKARSVPPIHDISTNPSQPLVFSAAVMTARGASSNPVLDPKDATVPFDKTKLGPWSGRTLVDIQAEAYPTIKPLILEGVKPADAYKKIQLATKAKGWTIVSQDPSTMRLEATAQSFWFGFKDDVVLSVSGVGNGAQVDMRSVSRVGVSDLGANAKRIEAMFAAVKGS